MKQDTNSTTVPAATALLGLAVLVGLAAGELSWAAAGTLGLAVLNICAILPTRKLAPVRIRSQTRRFCTPR